MQSPKAKTHHDGIWISTAKELNIAGILSATIQQNGYVASEQTAHLNYGYPYAYKRDHQRLYCRLVDSVFLNTPEVWNSSPMDTVVTDNVPLLPNQANIISVIPEFWHIWKFDPEYIDRPAKKFYNCFMNRIRGDRSVVFYELLKRNLLSQGFVSYNCSLNEYENEHERSELKNYDREYDLGKRMIPYNTVESHGTLEQCIIDSKISVVLETYTSDSHIVFSEKIFRCLQMPRPWLLYCSPGSIELLKQHDFDVLDDIVDTSYDKIPDHGLRLLTVLDQLETFAARTYSQKDYQRFYSAMQHNQQVLKKLHQAWSDKFQHVIKQIQTL